MIARVAGDKRMPKEIADQIIERTDGVPLFVEELTKMVDDFEAMSETARTARRDHIGARVDLEVITAELKEQVRLLDGITRYRFGGDAEMMAEWNAAKQMLRVPIPPVAPVTPAPTPPAGEVEKAA